MSIILGLDPGSRVTGFGLVKLKGQSFEALSYGVIELDVRAGFPQRMRELSEGVEEILAKYRPENVVIEKIFLGKNADSAFKLGHARGVLMCAAAKSGAQVYEYATRVVKKSLTGKGSGGKEEVQQMVQRLLGIREIKKVDASDALAMAIHHAYFMMSGDRMTKQLIEVGL